MIGLMNMATHGKDTQAGVVLFTEALSESLKNTTDLVCYDFDFKVELNKTNLVEGKKAGEEVPCISMTIQINLVEPKEIE